MDKHVNLLKLSVGSDSVDSIKLWQAEYAKRWSDGFPRHVTRMWPKREAEILQGGSIYWVIKGQIQCRQRILRLDELRGEDGIRRCAIVLNPELHSTQTAPKRPFQGWRYLKPEDTPADLSAGHVTEEALPETLSQALAEIGVL